MTNCGQNEIFDSVLDKCVCTTGFYRINGICATCPLRMTFSETLKRCIPICGSNEVYDGVINACKCAEEFYRVNGNC